MNFIIFIVYSFAFSQLQQNCEYYDQGFRISFILSMAAYAHCPLVSSIAVRLIPWRILQFQQSVYDY